MGECGLTGPKGCVPDTFRKIEIFPKGVWERDYIIILWCPGNIHSPYPVAVVKGKETEFLQSTVFVQKNLFSSNLWKFFPWKKPTHYTVHTVQWYDVLASHCIWHLIAYGSLHVIVKLSLVHFFFTSSTLIAFLWHSKMLHLPWCLRHIQDSGLAWLLWVYLSTGSWVCIQFGIHWNLLNWIFRDFFPAKRVYQSNEALHRSLKLSPYKMVLGPLQDRSGEHAYSNKHLPTRPESRSPVRWTRIIQWIKYKERPLSVIDTNFSPNEPQGDVLYTWPQLVTCGELYNYWI